MEHPIIVEKYQGTLKDLARDICNLRYDTLSELLGYFSTELVKDSLADAERDSLKYNGKGRIQLSKKLEETAIKISEAQNSMNKTWKICEPYIGKK